MNSVPQSQVDEWLAAQGFAQYAALFAENAIDFELLPTLSEADLRSLGLPFGHARKLALAAAQFREPTATTPPASALTPLPPVEPERRQLTVMFCDLVGSTALSSRLDPEDLRTIIQRYQKTCGEVVARYGGFIAQYLGDGLLVYFGYPQAQEDAAERAVRTGLDIIAAVAALDVPSGERIQVRLGAATGLAVVGDLIGRGSSEQAAVIGQTPNLAARIQSLAEPGCLTIAESTRKLVGHLFDYRDLGLQTLKGIEGEIRVLQVLGERSQEARFESIRSSRITCIGRQREIDFLLRKWRLACDGQGQTILAWGEAGIGKSRLLRQLQEQLGEEITRVQVQCSPQHLSSPLYPIISANQKIIGLKADDTPQQKLDRLSNFLSRANAATSLPLLAAMMSVPLASAEPALAADEQKEQTLRMCVQFIHTLAERKPILYVLEDVHWIDPTTDELLARLVESVPGRRILLIVTCRPEYRPAWLGHPQVEALDLGRLGELEVRQMVKSLAGKRLPEQVIQQILAKTDGVPLFVEELTRTLLESGFLTESGDAWVLDKPLPPMAIPLTLQDSLMARLDRLASAKEVVQVAAAIGRTFSYAMLAAVLDCPDSTLQAALERLDEAGLLFPRGQPPEAEYSFKHALVLDVAYESLLRSRRAVLHTRIVRALETHFPETVESQPEILAYHCTRADLTEKAIDYGLLAGRRALARSANREAIQLLGDAIALTRSIADDNLRDEIELSLQLALGQASLAHFGYSAHEPAEVFGRARELAERVGKSQQYYEMLYGLYASITINAQFNVAAELGQRFLDLARQENDSGYCCIGYRMLGVVMFYRGQLVEAQQELKNALALYDPAKHRSLALRFGTDIAVTALNYLAWADAIMGLPAAAEQHVQLAIEQARRCDHALSLAQALHMRCVVMTIARDYVGLQAASQIALKFCEEKNLGYFLFWARNFSAFADAALGNPETLLALRERLPTMPDFAKSAAVWWFHLWVAKTLLALGKPQEALVEANTSLELVLASSEIWGLAEIEKLRAECLLAQDPPADIEAESCLRNAIASAHRIGALTYELRAGLALYQLMASTGRQAEGRDMLQAIYTTGSGDETLPENRLAQTILTG